MSGLTLRRLAVVVALAASVPVVTAGPAAANGPTITGTGSSYAAVALDQWVAQMSSIYGDSINYQTSSSVIGLNDYAQSEVDFGASEIGYSTGQANDEPKAGTYQYLPDVAGATCFMYNLTGSLGEHITTLRLDSSAIEGIFTGTITNWDSPALRRLNPGIPLPNASIVNVFRTDASGENYLLGDYLAHTQHSAYAAYSRTLGFPETPQAIWPYPQQGGGSGKYNFSSWVGQSGSDNASNYVGSTRSTITYVETAYALLHHEPCAAVRNASGRYVEPSEEADAVALERARLLPDLEQKLAGVYANPEPGTYPLSAYSYLLVSLSPNGHIDPAKGKVLGQFVNYLACAGQQAAGQLGYSPLPPNLVEEDLEGIARITGAAPPPRLSASNCRNPYVDGQLPLPGEPSIGGGGPKVPKSAQGHPAGGSGGTSGVGSTASGGGGGTGGRPSSATAEPGSGTTGGGGPASAGPGAVATAGTSVTGLYPGQQMVAGLTTGARLPDKTFVGTDLQADAHGAGATTTAGAITALALIAVVGAAAGLVFLRRRRIGRAS